MMSYKKNSVKLMFFILVSNFLKWPLGEGVGEGKGGGESSRTMKKRYFFTPLPQFKK